MLDVEVECDVSDRGHGLLRGLRFMSKIGVMESTAHTSMRMKAPAFRRYNFSTTLPTTRDANQDMAMTENEMNRRAAQIVFNDIRENQRAARAAQIFFTKWIINALCLMHSGSIVALLLQAHVSGRTAPASLWWFVCGSSSSSARPLRRCPILHLPSTYSRGGDAIGFLWILTCGRLHCVHIA